jgi:hypothetical protein
MITGLGGFYNGEVPLILVMVTTLSLPIKWLDFIVYRNGTINTGDGKDIITSSNGIENHGTINTGNGADFIIANGGFSGMGSVFLGNGKDYLKGFGTGNFNGGNNQDTLELTSGSYTVGISGTTVSFTNSGVIM